MLNKSIEVKLKKQILTRLNVDLMIPSILSKKGKLKQFYSIEKILINGMKIIMNKIKEEYKILIK